jgi:hypothetical protein
MRLEEWKDMEVQGSGEHLGSASIHPAYDVDLASQQWLDR